MPNPNEITQMLQGLSNGDQVAMHKLMPVIYEELRQLAHHRLRFERSDMTLNTTALVHEAYFRLVDQHSVKWQNRNHFFAIASQAMRRILVNYAEKRRTLKRGGPQENVRLDDVMDWLSDEQSEEILALDEALERLKLFDERGYQVVIYRFYGGLNYDEIADVMNLTNITVRRAWNAAKLWLNRELKQTLLS